VPVARVGGVDVARGLALLGMFAVHVLPTFTGDGGPTTATVIAGGRSAATFVLVAGIGLAFVSGGRRAVRGAERIGVGAGTVRGRGGLRRRAGPGAAGVSPP
jgi:uncharacterized membrane protein